MIHHEQPRLVFVHIPKTAGTSIEVMLARQLCGVAHPDELDKRTRIGMHLPVRGIDGQHANYREYALQGPQTGYFRFSVVRHPLVRAVSQVAYLRKGDAGMQFFRGRCWKDWLMKLASTRRAMIWGHDLGACQVDYLIDSEGRLAMDFIGRFEQLDAAWETICARLGFAAPPPLPHILKGPGVDLDGCFDEESKAALVAKYARDFTTFGYSEELPGPVEANADGPGCAAVHGLVERQAVKDSGAGV